MKIPNYTQLKETVTEIMMTKVTSTRLLLVIIYYRAQKKLPKCNYEIITEPKIIRDNDEKVTKVQLRDYF